MSEQIEDEGHIDPMAEDLGVDDESHVVLSDEDGEEVEFEYIGSVDYQGDEYIVLLPAGDDDEEAEVMILKVEEVPGSGEDGEDEEQYVSVESEDVLNAVFELFKSQNADEYDFVD